MGEFVEGGRDPQRGVCVESEFVMAAAEVLDEGVPRDHYRGRSVGA